MAPAWSHVETRVFIATPAGTIGIHVQNASESVERRYLHKDHLGSVVAVTGTNGTVLAEYSFDTWGTHRDPSDWSAGAGGSQAFATALSSDRGFTGHEMLDHLGLVHMNGRIYDSALGRFLSPDPLIQAPENLQSFNRYSYVFNNPLTHTDPSGFVTEKAAKAVMSATTNLGETLGAVALSALDNIGGTLTEASKQVEDYYSDSAGNSKVDQTSQIDAQQIGAPGNENIPQSGIITDNNYGLGTGSISGLSWWDAKIAGPFRARMVMLGQFGGGLRDSIAGIFGGGDIAKGGTQIGSSMVPVVGEVQDAHAVLNGALPAKERWFAAGSLALNVLTLGLLPNYTGTARGVKEMATGSVDDYLRIADDLDISTTRNGAVFYSGSGNRELAEQFAVQNGRTTLEMTQGGRWLDEQSLFSANSPLTADEATMVWSRLSQRYAEGASGNAIGFVQGARAQSIFDTVEYPALISNPNVSNLLTGGH